MNANASAVAGSVTRHVMTGGGVGGLLASSDQIIQAVSLALTLIGLIWGIIDKIKGKTPNVQSLLLTAGLAGSLAFTGCAARGLDPAGPYRGDATLANADVVIIHVFDAFTAIQSLAARNPDVVTQSAALSALVDRANRELDGDPQPDEILANLIGARDAYLQRATPDNATALQTHLSAARALLDFARSMLPALTPP